MAFVGKFTGVGYRGAHRGSFARRAGADEVTLEGRLHMPGGDSEPLKAIADHWKGTILTEDDKIVVDAKFSFSP